MNHSYEQKIQNLRNEGLKYREIAKILNCSLSTISYYLGKDQDLKSKRRLDKYRTNEQRLSIVRLKSKYYAIFQPRGLKSKKVKQFPTFTYEEFLKHLKKFDKCYLTGLKIDYMDTGSWEMDHIIPYIKGGDNSLDNLRPCIRWANRMKHDCLLEDFRNQCKIISDNID